MEFDIWRNEKRWKVGKFGTSGRTSAAMIMRCCDSSLKFFLITNGVASLRIDFNILFNIHEGLR
ncbi:hypothetical protein TIFTF001_039101 [Ficus carica]|uniref:Uncharacterized protein n=1 Tax=Ficus carica TaxID=3494 RepID=A0AA88JEP8_FICCA|nr:hypothetical protein TIFTF001_039101 [Ficus carica]